MYASVMAWATTNSGQSGKSMDRQADGEKRESKEENEDIEWLYDALWRKVLYEAAAAFGQRRITDYFHQS